VGPAALWRKENAESREERKIFFVSHYKNSWLFVPHDKHSWREEQRQSGHKECGVSNIVPTGNDRKQS
jgi:hypothetical protein